MEYLYLTTQENELLDNITIDNQSNMVLRGLPYNDGFIIPADVLQEPLFDFYKALLLSLPKIVIE